MPVRVLYMVLRHRANLAASSDLFLHSRMPLDASPAPSIYEAIVWPSRFLGISSGAPTFRIFLNFRRSFRSNW